MNKRKSKIEHSAIVEVSQESRNHITMLVPLLSL